MLLHAPEDIAKDLDDFRDQLLDIAENSVREDVRHFYELTRELIAERLAHSGLHEYAGRFRPSKGLANTYGASPDPHLADRIRATAHELEAFTLGLGSYPELWKEKIRRGLARTKQLQKRQNGDLYIDEGRIEALQRLNPLVEAWDLGGVIQLCVEINNAYASESWLSLGMCVRALMNHVPQLFLPDDRGPSFSQVASQAPTSIKKSMATLEGWRPIPDWVNHNPIRKHVSLPNPQQMDVKAHLDVLLAHIIEKLKEQAAG